MRLTVDAMIVIGLLFVAIRHRWMCRTRRCTSSRCGVSRGHLIPNGGGGGHRDGPQGLKT
jgi:hypothetical protein